MISPVHDSPFPACQTTTALSSSPSNSPLPSAGAQVLFPPLSSGMRDIVRVAFAGHRERECGDGSSWQLRGIHPLAGGVVLDPSVLQFGYELSGGAYAR
jgi:hypothetical protein